MQPLFQNIRNEQAGIVRSSKSFICTSLTVDLFSIFATSNIDLVANIYKIYSMQRILIRIKNNTFVKYDNLHPEYAAKLVASSEYYHCHWILLGVTCYNLLYDTYVKNTFICFSFSSQLLFVQIHVCALSMRKYFIC